MCIRDRCQPIRTDLTTAEDNEWDLFLTKLPSADYLFRSSLPFSLSRSFTQIHYDTQRTIASMLNFFLKSLQMARASSRNLSQTRYENLDFTRLKNILPSSLKPVPINLPSDLIREDETDDARFYCLPRFVHHIDDRARYVLSKFYRHAIHQKPETKTLDLCSSWTSHLPNDFIGRFTNSREYRIFSPPP